MCAGVGTPARYAVIQCDCTGRWTLANAAKAVPRARHARDAHCCKRQTREAEFKSHARPSVAGFRPSTIACPWDAGSVSMSGISRHTQDRRTCCQPSWPAEVAGRQQRRWRRRRQWSPAGLVRRPQSPASGACCCASAAVPDSSCGLCARRREAPQLEVRTAKQDSKQKMPAHHGQTNEAQTKFRRQVCSRAARRKHGSKPRCLGGRETRKGTTLGSPLLAVELVDSVEHRALLAVASRLAAREHHRLRGVELTHPIAPVVLLLLG